MILTCRRLVERVTDAREGALSTADRLAWNAHLAWCRDCRAYIDQMDAAVDAVRELATLRPPVVVRAPDALLGAVIEALCAPTRK